MRPPRLLKLLIFIVVTTLLTTSCTKNYLAQFAMNDDESYLYDAIIDINKADYTDAITACSNISSTSLQTEQYATVCASAYAGQCGFTMTFFENNITTFTAPWGAFMIKTLGSTSPSAISECDDAETILRNIGPASTRSSDANLFMMALSLYKIGVIAKALGDPTNSGLLSGSFDACSIATSPVDYQQMMAEAFWDLSQSAAQLTNDSLVGTFALGIAGECTLLSSVTDSGGKAENLCSATSVSAITADQIKGGLSMLKEGSSIGVNQGTCGGGTVASTNCQCL